MRLTLRNRAERPKSSDSIVIADTGESARHFALGRRGEEIAARHLESAGYRIVAANFSAPIGRNTLGAIVNAEIDVVAYDVSTLCFVEVKTRASDEFAPPEVNVDLRKRRQIARAARAYRRMLGLMGASHRYDVVTVILPSDRESESVDRSRVELLKNFWSDETLRKRRWYDARWD